MLLLPPLSPVPWPIQHPGIPEDIGSVRGPQLISRVCWAFFNFLGVTVSLSSGFHPQSNGQTERKIKEILKEIPENLLPWSLELLEMHRIPSTYLQLDLHHSSAYSVTSLPCSHGPGNCRTYHLSIPAFGRARESGTSPITVCRWQCVDKESRAMLG